MSILGTFFSKLLGHKTSSTASTPPKTSSPPPVTSTTPKPAVAPTPPVTPAPVARMDDVDLEQLLDGLVQKSGQKLDWRHSIVDLMKAVGMESSLAERKELSKELGYTGDSSDSAKMNTWLHAEVFKRIAANGGKVPGNLTD